MHLRRIFTKSVVQGIALYLMLTLGMSYYAPAQVSLFQNLTTRDGLPSNYIFDACEDADGYLWLGTDKGLARFDGFQWQVFNTENGLPGNYISSVNRAGPTGLWLIVSSKGVYHFDTRTGKTKFITANALDHFLQTDDAGNLFYYHRQADQSLSFRWANATNPLQVTEMKNPFRRGDGYSVSVEFNERTVRCFPMKDSARPRSGAISLPAGWKADTLEQEVDEGALFRKAADHIYISASSVFYAPPGKPLRKLQLFPFSNSYLNTLRLPNELVIWNEKDGLYFINDNGTIQHFTEKDGLGSNMVTDVHVLQNGRLLICTLGGGLSYKLPEGNAILHTGGLPVKGLSLNAGKIYAAVDKQLLRFDLSDYSSASYPLQDKSVQSVDIWDNDIYVSSLSGLTVYAESGNTLVQKKKLPLGAGFSNVIQSGNRYLAGTYGTHVMELRGNQVIPDSTTPFVSERIIPVTDGLVSYNYEDGLQFAWHNGQRTSLSVQNGLPSNAVYDVHEYKDSFWISTRNGVAVYTKGKIVSTLTAADGIIGSRCVYTFHDSSGACWILTDKYLGKLSGGKVVTYLSLPVRDGMGDYVHKAIYDPAQHILFTGTLKNIYLSRLNHTGLSSITRPPRLLQATINGIQAEDSSFRLPLNYRELSFVFRPLLVNPFGKVSIYYKLEGFDEQFTELKDSLRVHFNKLRSGSYRLLARSVNEDGSQSAEVTLCTFTITKPYWQSGWFITLLLAGTGLLAYLLTTGYYRRKQKQKEKERLLEQQLVKERERISRELHDNLGTSLVTIIAQSDNIETKLRHHQPEEALKKVLELSDQSREAMNILRETIWAVQEGTHSFDSFLNRIRNFLQRTYAVANIQYTCEVSGSPGKDLSPEQTLHLFRCVQECTQNIIKHAAATRADYSFFAREKKLAISIKDNGTGFDTSNTHSGNGIYNIKNRVKELGGLCSIVSVASQGTIITIETEL